MNNPNLAWRYYRKHSATTLVVGLVALSALLSGCGDSPAATSSEKNGTGSVVQASAAGAVGEQPALQTLDRGNANQAGIEGSCFFSVEGNQQGKFKGDEATQNLKDKKDKIECTYYEFGVKSPRDTASGQATGRRQYQGIILRHVMGAASPQFFKAAVTNENLKTVKIEFIRTNKKGEEEVYYTITLTNANISELKEYLPDTQAGPSQTIARIAAQEEITFTFAKIEMTSNDSKITVVDNWNAAS